MSRWLVLLLSDQPLSSAALLLQVAQQAPLGAVKDPWASVGRGTLSIGYFLLQCNALQPAGSGTLQMLCSRLPSDWLSPLGPEGGRSDAGCPRLPPCPACCPVTVLL
jgi:hypothetical protein